MKKAIYIVTSMDAGGAETVFMKYYRALDKSRYQLDFCVSSDAKGFYDDEIRSLGGGIIHTVKKTEAGPVASFRRLSQIAKEGDYCCAVRSSQHSLSCLDLLAMRFGGIPKTVFRSSNTGTVSNGRKEGLLHSAFKPLVKVAATDYAAPSTEAGMYMFGPRAVKSARFHLLHNALNMDLYSFCQQARDKVRMELGISGSAFVVGHIGRFNQQKNHALLLEVFFEITKVKKDAVLLLAGKGETQLSVEKRAKELGIADKVVFAGVRADAERLYSAMDVFVFPSLYEGLPNVIVEAQANGLPCVISDTITKEVIACQNLAQMPLFARAEQWANKAMALARQENTSASLRKAGFDMEVEMPAFVSLLFGE